MSKSKTSELEGPRSKSPRATGITSEAIVLARLVELGYGVSIPFGDMQRYDFVVDDGTALTRAQVKTGRLRDGAVVFSARSTNWHSREQRAYFGEADYFLVYCPDTNEIYRILVADCSASGSVGLRVDATQPRTGRPCLRWARDHVFDQGARLVTPGPLPGCAKTHPGLPSRIGQRKTSGGGTRRYCTECHRVQNRRSLARRASA